MAAFQKFQQFPKDLIEAKHNFASNVFKVMLTNTQPTSVMTVKTDVTDISAGNGYTAGGSTVVVTTAVSAGIAKVVGADPTITASGGSIGPFRYAVLYNDTTSGKPLVGYWDYGASITLAATEALVVDFDGTNGIFQLG